MFDQLFNTGSGYFEYPSFEVALFSLLLAFVLSTVIALTYKFTFKGKILPDHFFQAMILSSIVTSMIMMAVGNNLAVGFGIIGAVAIIRFRTRIQDTRNIIFIFAGISVGIATGVYGYSIAVAGTAIYTIVAFLLYFSPYSNAPEFDYDVSMNFPKDITPGDNSDLFESCCKSYTLESKQSSKSSYQLNYVVRLKDNSSYESLFEYLSSFEGITKLKISKNAERKKL